MNMTIRRIWIGARRVFLMVAITGLLGIGLPTTVRAAMPAAKPASVGARGRLTVDINKVDYNAKYKGVPGMIVHVYLEAGNLRGTPVRVGLFYFWENDDPLEASQDTPSDFVTSSGGLTWQDVVNPRYNESEWKDIPIFMPYAFFPAVSEPANAFVVAVAGIDGQDFTRYGTRNYFTMNP
jgi:hypothetical protein